MRRGYCFGPWLPGMNDEKEENEQEEGKEEESYDTTDSSVLRFTPAQAGCTQYHLICVEEAVSSRLCSSVASARIFFLKWRFIS